MLLPLLVAQGEQDFHFDSDLGSLFVRLLETLGKVLDLCLGSVQRLTQPGRMQVMGDPGSGRHALPELDLQSQRILGKQVAHGSGFGPSTLQRQKGLLLGQFG